MKPNRLISVRLLPCGLLSFLMLAGSAQAQNQIINGDLAVTYGFKTGTTVPGGGMELRLGGLMIAKGFLNSSPVLVSADQGAGTRLLWHPRKAAFRAGYVYGIQWNEANIGYYSTAFGNSSNASGEGSTAMGVSANALGNYSTAMGGGTIANSFGSTVMGVESYTWGLCATAMGEWAAAIGDCSTAMGNSTAAGHYSTSMGRATASGGFSTAMGSAVASGLSSTAMGYETKANAHSSVALGKHNIGGGNSTTWVPTDPLFEIGNGSAYNSPSNAVTVYKNGNMDVQGAITCAPGGDIPMFGE